MSPQNEDPSVNYDDIQLDNNLANGHQQEWAGEVVENYQEDVDEKPEWSMDYKLRS